MPNEPGMPGVGETSAIGSGPRSGFILPGFVLTLLLRMLTSSLLIVIPLFMSYVLNVPASSLGLYILLLWAGNAVGVALTVVLVKRHATAALAGFGTLALAMLGFAFLAAAPADVAVLATTAGVGMGMAQPFLPVLMHLDSDVEDPYRGIGLYSVALGVGLIAGPVVAWLLESFYAGTTGYSLIFLLLFLAAVVGVASVASRMLSRRGKAAPEFDTHPLVIRQWVDAMRNRGFLDAFNLNLLYSLLLPVVLSYGGVYAAARYGLGPAYAYLLFAVVFALSVVIRAALTQLKAGGRLSLPVSGFFLTGAFIAMSFAPSLPLFVAGMLAFSVPHALILPETKYRALTSVERGIIMNASYAFQASSGVAEFVSPAIAVVLIEQFGISNLFTAWFPLAVVSMLYILFLYRNA